MSDSVQVPDGWKEELLGNVAQVVMGQSPPSTTYNDKRNGLRSVRNSGHHIIVTQPLAA